MSYKVVRLAHAGKRNRYLAATGIAFIGYVLFLSSALWFPGQKKSMEYTPLGIQQEIGETTCMVSVVYWAYAPEQEAMLVELDLDGIRSEVTFSAVDKARDPIPVEVKLAQSGTYVLKLSSVPEDFQAISLCVMVEGQTRRLYTNIDQVEQVNRLHFYPDLTGYYQARIHRNIEVLQRKKRRFKSWMIRSQRIRCRLRRHQNVCRICQDSSALMQRTVSKHGKKRLQNARKSSRQQLNKLPSWLMNRRNKSNCWNHRSWRTLNANQNQRLCPNRTQKSRKARKRNEMCICRKPEGRFRLYC